MEGFLEEGGLEVLLEGVESLSAHRVVQLADALLLLECIACIKSVMNSKIGLQVITQHHDYVNILVKGINTHASQNIFCKDMKMMMMIRI